VLEFDSPLGGTCKPTLPPCTCPARTFGSTGEPGPNTLQSPTGVSVDDQGNVYIVDSGNNRVLEYYHGDTIADAVFGQPYGDFVSNLPNLGGIMPSEGTLSQPEGIAVDLSNGGNLFVADSGNNRVLFYRQSPPQPTPTPTPAPSMELRILLPRAPGIEKPSERVAKRGEPGVFAGRFEISTPNDRHRRRLDSLTVFFDREDSMGNPAKSSTGVLYGSLFSSATLGMKSGGKFTDVDLSKVSIPLTPDSYPGGDVITFSPPIFISPGAQVTFYLTVTTIPSVAPSTPAPSTPTPTATSTPSIARVIGARTTAQAGMIPISGGLAGRFAGLSLALLMLEAIMMPFWRSRKRRMLLVTGALVLLSVAVTEVGCGVHLDPGCANCDPQYSGQKVVSVRFGIDSGPGVDYCPAKSDSTDTVLTVCRPISLPSSRTCDNSPCFLFGSVATQD